jgi:hypothetical protein
MIRVQRLLKEFGQILQPMRIAPRDGRAVLAYSEHFGMVPVRWVEGDLPKWVENPESGKGFLDWAFTGWYDQSTFRPMREEELTRLLVAYIDDLRAEKRDDVLKILETPAAPKVSNDNPKAGGGGK